jgi:hypothetical protein
MKYLPILLAIVAIAACSSSNTAAQRVPSDLVIRFAEGGGFTGRWEGAAITGDGTVRSWSPGVRDSVFVALGKLSSSTMNALWQKIEKEGLLDRPGGGAAGNMTRSIQLTSGGKTVEVRWSYGSTPDARTQPFAAFYEQCRTAVDALKR